MPASCAIKSTSSLFPYLHWLCYLYILHASTHTHTQAHAHIHTSTHTQSTSNFISDLIGRIFLIDLLITPSHLLLFPSFRKCQILLLFPLRTSAPSLSLSACAHLRPPQIQYRKLHLSKMSKLTCRLRQMWRFSWPPVQKWEGMMLSSVYLVNTKRTLFHGI